MLGDGIRNAWTNKARRKNQIISAIAMDFVHSHSAWVARPRICFRSFTCLSNPSLRLHPFGEEDVGLAFHASESIRSENEVSAVRRKHWEWTKSIPSGG